MYNLNIDPRLFYIEITIHKSNVMPHNSNNLECRNTYDCVLSGTSGTHTRCNPHGFCEGKVIKNVIK